MPDREAQIAGRQSCLPATPVIAGQGLGASTLAIAKAAEVYNGSLFVYFDTKSTLINELYVALKTEMAAAAVEGLPVGSDPQAQIRHMWNGWLRWATTFPEKRRTLAQLNVSDDVTAESRRVAHSGFGGIADLLDQSRADGAVRDSPLGFVFELVSAMADATADAMIREPEHAESHGRIAFDAVWRILA